MSPVNTTKKDVCLVSLWLCIWYSSLRSRWLLRSESSTALMGWFGIQLDAGSYFGMPDKVFWWRTIAAVSGDSLMVYGWEHTPCLWLHKTMHYVLFFPYHRITHSTTYHTGQRHTTSASTHFYFYYYRKLLTAKFYFTLDNKTHASKTVTVCFQKLLFLKWTDWDFYYLCSTGNSGTLSVYSTRVERGPHLGCAAQSSQSLWVF